MGSGFLHSQWSNLPWSSSRQKSGVARRLLRLYAAERRRTPMQPTVAKKTYGTVSADRKKEMSGLEFVQGLANGTLPLNTMAETLGYDVVEAEKGRVVVTAQPNDTY